MADTVDFADLPEGSHEFHRYEVKLGHNHYRLLAGLVCPERPGLIRRHLDFNRFRAKWSKIPCEATRVDTEADYVSEAFCDRTKTRLAPDNLFWEAAQGEAAQGEAAQGEAGPARYYTHDNGGRPFLVRLAKGSEPHVAAFVRADLVRGGPYYIRESDLKGEPAPWSYVTKVFEANAARVFVGKSPVTDETRSSGGHGPEFDGNSLLVELREGRQYVFIGADVRQFEATTPIVEYVSPVGNSDVPYPYAVDSGLVYYLLAEGRRVQFRRRRGSHPAVVVPAPKDPYQLYYGHQKVRDLEVAAAPLGETVLYARPGW